ncbi:MAG: DNA replication complex GINS family protein [Candidatus Aenigmarchaeota archaeon]|nr:DNA replication complex GINS family protein [Candidatus Aenigmarchaeota archaeon]
MPEEQEAITFEYIRKIQRAEQHEPKLSKIPSDFYEKAKKYLDQKKKLAKKKSDRSSELELTNIQRLLEDIYNRRETKILQQAVFATRTGIPVQNLTKSEEKLFRQLADSLKFQRQKTLNIFTKKTKEKEEKTKLKKVKFTEDIPEFMGSDLKKYGPFKSGEEGKIPFENAELMIKTGNAEQVE